MSADQISVSDTDSSLGRETVPYQVVARRYRPQEFSELIGQSQIAKALSNAIQTDRIGHAYLFTGARGVGKTSSARIFAKALNCVHGPTEHPCNECDICRAISTGDDIDVLEIDGASNRGIDEIRQLRQNATIRPSRARFKIYIIDEVHMLTREAFNALLKTLEEPPEHVKFIFCTTEPNKIPITILSRCQRFDFLGINASSISARLRQILQMEGVTVEEGVCETLSRRANGSMRDAQSLLEQLLALAPKDIHLDDVHRMLGTVDDQKLFDLLAAIVHKNPGALFPILEKASETGVDFGILIEQMLGFHRDLMVAASNCPPELLMYAPISRYTEIHNLAQRLGIRRILASMQILDQTLQRMKYSTQGRILAELSLVRLSTLDQLQDIAQLVNALRTGQLGGSSGSIPVCITSGSGGVEKKNITSNQVSSIEKRADNNSLSSFSKPQSPVSHSIVSESNKTFPVDSSSGSVSGVHSSEQERHDESPVLSSVRSEIGSSSPSKVKQPVDFASSGTESSPSASSNVSSISKTPSTKDDSSTGKYAVEELNNDLAQELWNRVLSDKSLGTAGRLGNVFSKVEFVAPDTIFVRFSTDNLVGYNSCEQELGHLQSILQQNISGLVRLKIEKVASDKMSKAAVPQEKKTLTKREMIQELNEHPFVVAAKKKFNLEILDVKLSGHTPGK